METFSDKAALLKFYLEAGVDEAIGDRPVNRFAAPSAAAETTPLRETTLPPPRAKPPPISTIPTANLADTIKAAESLAKSCKTIPELQAAVENFEGCSLSKRATHTVFASGPVGTKLMIVDRPPSAEEDRSGKPFAGDAGVLLGKMLAAIKLDMEDIYRGSVLPWRPAGGVPPTESDLAICLPFAERHIALAKPEFLLLCGEAAGYLMKKKASINKLRGRWAPLQFEDVAVNALPIFHPGFLLDYPSAKKQAWTDLQLLQSAMEASQ